MSSPGVRTCGDDEREEREALLARVPGAPAMILRAVDEVHVAVPEDGEGRHAASLRVVVHVLHVQQFVVRPVALPRHEGRAVLAAAVTHDA